MAARRVKETMLDKTQGYKVYILCGIGAVYAIAGWLLGPVDIAGLQIPALDFNTMLQKLWDLALVAGFRSATKKVTNGGQ